MSLAIDIHCHLFNADDIPIKGFIDRRAPKLIAVILDKILQSIAPGDRMAGDDTLEDMSDEEITLLLRRILEEDPELRAAFQHELTGSMNEDALAGFDAMALVKRYIRWIKLLARSHGTILRKLQHTYPDVELFTPLMMDMDFWFEDSAATSVQKQCEVLARLTRRSEGAIHPFVAFDPERERRFEGQQTSSMNLVQNAINQHGFIGVKLYPPLGYTPTGNGSIQSAHPEDYDRVFEKLFSYCEDNEIPITTHCTNGGAEAHDGFGKYADPDYWEPVLTRHAKLRLNFAHFGGDQDLVKNQNAAWAWKIAGLMERFDHVYADTGHHSITFDEDLCDKYFHSLSALVAKHPCIKQRLMFGSDWHMIVRAKKHSTFYKAYLNAYSNHFSESETNLFMGENAARFLGLNHEGKNRARLFQYYTTNGLPFPSWWNRSK